MVTTESPRNACRRESPGAEGWSRSVRPGDPDKLLLISADCHANEPASYLADNIEPEHRERNSDAESDWTREQIESYMREVPCPDCGGARLKPESLAVPWLLETMDYAYKAHHFWARPVIPELPSTYFRRHCFATFQEDHVGVDTAEQYDLVPNSMWANDYPHHEGSWPHSAASIERQMADLTDDSRAKILELNAKRVFGL